jgi:hypothetical protein
VAPHCGRGIRGGLLVVVFVASAGYLQSFSAYGFNIRDEGAIPDGALRVLQGEVPWKDFQGYAPGAYYLHAGAFALFGPHLKVARGLAVLIGALMVTLMVQAGARLMPLPFAVLAGFLLLLAPGVYYGRYLNFFSLLNIVVFPWAVARGPKGGFLLGMVGGVTTLFREDLGLAVLAVGTVCLILATEVRSPASAPRRAAVALSLASGAALVLLPWGIYYWTHSVLGYIVRFHVSALLGGYQKMSLPYPRLPALLEEGRWGEAVIFYGPVIVFSVTAVLLLRRYGRGDVAGQTVPLAYIVLVGGLAFHQALWRTTVENHVKVIGPVILLGCYLLGRGARALSQQWWTSPRLRPLAVVGGVLLAGGPVLYAREVLTAHGFTVGSVSVLRDDVVRVELPGGPVYAPRGGAGPPQATARYLRAHTSPGDPIFVIPFAPMLYVLADRRNPSFFGWVLPAEVAIYADVEPRIVADLDRARPRYVVFEDFALDEREDRRFRRYAPVVFRYIAEHYVREAQFGELQILRRRGDAAAGQG